MIAVVEELKAELTDQPQNPLRPLQIDEYRDELGRLGAMVEGRDLDGVKRDFIQADRGQARRRATQVRKILADQAPKPLGGDRKDRVAWLVSDVVERVIRPALLPRASMRRNPPGAVGHVLRTEFQPDFKDAVLAVKRGLRALDPDNRDPDYTNIERFRPEGLNPDGAATHMVDAQIPGLFAQTPLAKARWPLGEPTADTALKQVQQRERATNGGKRKRELTERQRAAMVANLAKGRIAKVAKPAAAGSTEREPAQAS